MKLTSAFALYALSAVSFLLVGMVVPGNELTELLVIGKIADMLLITLGIVALAVAAALTLPILWRCRH